MDGKSVRRATLAECLASIEGFGPLNGVNTCIGTLRDLLVASASENPCSAFLGGKRCEYPKEHAPLLLHRVGRHAWVDYDPNDLEISKYADMCDAAAKLLSDATGLEVYRHGLVEGIEILLGKRNQPPSAPMPSAASEGEECPHCKPTEGAVNWVPGHIHVGFGVGWRVCIYCNGTQRLVPKAAPTAPWISVINREGAVEALPWADEESARNYFDQAQQQWSESWLCRVEIGPRDMMGMKHPKAAPSSGAAQMPSADRKQEVVEKCGDFNTEITSSLADKPVKCVMYDVRIRVQGPKTFIVRATFAEPDIRLLPRDLFRESGCASNVVLDPVPAVPASPSSGAIGPYRVGWNDRVGGHTTARFAMSTNRQPVIYMVYTLSQGDPGHAWNDDERREYVRGWDEATAKIRSLAMPFTSATPKEKL